MPIVGTNHEERARSAFSARFKGKPNFMTDEIIGYGMLPDGRAVELSYSRFGKGELWGVTVIKKSGAPESVNGWLSCRDVSNAFGSRADAEQHIAKLAEA